MRENVEMWSVEKWSVEKLTERMLELDVGEKITLAGWHEYGDYFAYARVIQRIDTTPWNCEDMKAWVIGKCYEPEPLTSITEYDDYLENDVRAYLEDNELLEDDMVYVRVTFDAITEFVQGVFNDASTFGKCEYMSVGEAEYNLDQYRADGFEMPDGITPEVFVRKWNKMVFDHK